MMTMLRTLLCLAPLLPMPLALGEMRLQGRDDQQDYTADKYKKRAMQRVQTLGDYIYIGGGELSNWSDGERAKDALDESTAIKYTVTMPLTESWDVGTVDIYTIDNQDDRYQPSSINSFAYWHDTAEDRLYRWGGSIGHRGNMTKEDLELWEFETASDGEAGSGSWKPSYAANPDVFDNIMGTTDGAGISCRDKGFWIGGVGRISTDPRYADVADDKRMPVPGILTYDMATEKWSNDSTAGMSPPYGSVINAAAACAEGFPADPIVLPLGGRRTSPDDIGESDPRSMSNITFWSPESKQWYWQEASGDVPSRRDHPCLAGAKSTNGTYEIFMYGGRDDNGETQGDMHVLTLPGFQWFKIDAEAPQRLYHSCTTVGSRQMLSTGGMSKEWDWDVPDTWKNALGIFDMTDLRWKTSFDAGAAEYESPQLVQDWYEEGGLSRVNWSDPTVAAMFQDPEETTHDPSSDHDEDGSAKPNTGAIAGGVVGGVAGVALLSGLAWFFFRRRNRQKDKDTGSPSAHLMEDGHELPAATSKDTAKGADGSKMYYGGPGHNGMAEGEPRRAELEHQQRVELAGDHNAVEMPG